MTSLRIFFIGGLISFRALFNWLSPWIYVPSLLIAPIFQILLFASIGRTANIESDAFFVIGNAVQYSAIPCLFAMANTVAGERYTQTLGIVLVTPARRIPLFLGRSLPVVTNGFLVSMFSLVVGSLLLDVSIPPPPWRSPPRGAWLWIWWSRSPRRRAPAWDWSTPPSVCACGRPPYCPTC